MSLLGALIRGIFRRRKSINDEFFGEMVVDYVKVDGRKINYFSCEKKFLPGHDTVDITVYSSGTGPSERQKMTFKKLTNNYLEITEKINLKIKADHAENAEALEATDINKGFILESISIHEEEGDAVNWDLEYIAAEGKAYVDVNFIGEKIDFIDIDSLN